MRRLNVFLIMFVAFSLSAPAIAVDDNSQDTVNDHYADQLGDRLDDLTSRSTV